MQSQDPRSWAELSHEIHVTQDPRGRSRYQRKSSTWTDSASISRPTQRWTRQKQIYRAPGAILDTWNHWYLEFWYQDGWVEIGIDTHLRCIIDDQNMYLKIDYHQELSWNSVTRSEVNSSTWIQSRDQRKSSTWTDSASLADRLNGGPGRNKYIEHQARSWILDILDFLIFDIKMVKLRMGTKFPIILSAKRIRHQNTKCLSSKRSKTWI